MTDPGSFSVPCSIGGVDLGTHCVTWESISCPEGKIEDVLVKVDKFLLLADFVILDYEADREIPILLGQPFLSISHTFRDVHEGKLTIELNDKK
ncbi:uncharacterized protein E5676_scaffold609G001400 [Cucumis melo var. makuwa]|uniref:Uncharacterized protein n=1 Tax=Cucumis melo var. makuwa TaxID=1194695 RepID=A0A5D3DD06_CUCMM|nr:uncharacterized protein E6C27_scaffold60G001770 [Cucumis melo var. makuwa]TYK21464.1 uncharacterized protein E5676_scaffold609G001400 [Cucumis melo var. makuwa]